MLHFLICDGYSACSGNNNVVVLFLSLALSLTIQKSSVDFDNDRSMDVYFPPVSLDGKSACLQINFTAFAYFAVKLTYARPVTNMSKELLLFRSVQSLGREFRHWETTITPDMTEGEEFAVVLHARSSLLRSMAVINDVNLQMAECRGTGKQLRPIFMENYYCSYTIVE